MAEPTLSSLGDRLRERTQPLAPDDDLYGYAHAHLCEGMMLSFAQVAELVDPEDPYVPWEPLFDVDMCPAWALPWLAQIVGVRIPMGLDEQGQRDAIRGLASLKRGSPESILAAAKITLTGSQLVILRERTNGDAYQLQVITTTAETPDPVATLRAISRVLPAGILLTHSVNTTWDYTGMKTEGGTYAHQTTVYDVYNSLAAHAPV